MREELIRYVELLFRDSPGTEDVKQEILQNSLDRYDDLVAQGKSSAAAYGLAISGIGDVDELIGRRPERGPEMPAEPVRTGAERRAATRAVAIAMFILCPVPLFLLGNAVGLCLLLVFVAAGVALMSISRLNGSRARPERRNAGVRSALLTLGLVLFLVLGVVTGDWFVLWLIFPACGCIYRAITAALDLKEAMRK